VGAKRIIGLLEHNGFSDLNEYGAPVGYTVSNRFKNRRLADIILPDEGGQIPDLNPCLVPIAPEVPQYLAPPLSRARPYPA